MKQRTVLIIVGVIILTAGALRLKTFFVQDHALAYIKDQAVRVDIAADDRTRARGLSGRLELDPDAGMVFLFAKADTYNFWMKDMYLPLDMIWINNGHVVDITENIPAPSLGEMKLPLYSPKEPANIVLEVNAGYAQKHNIQIGDSFLLKY